MMELVALQEEKEISVSLLPPNTEQTQKLL